MKRDKLADYGDFLIRIVAGLIFVFAGYAKLTGKVDFTAMLTGLGFPLPGFLAFLVAVAELVGGVLLILGLWTYVAAILLAIVITFALVTVNISKGWNDFRYPLLLLAVLIRYIGTHGFGHVKDLFGSKIKFV